MFVNQNFSSMNNTDSIDITKLTSELCSMTGCDQELAVMQLMNCDYDLQMAANKILESMPNNKEMDDGWQIINRQKKFKKKEYKMDLGSNEESVKRINRNRNAKSSNANVNSKSGNFKSDEKLCKMINDIKSHNKRNRNKKSKDNLESLFKPINDSDIGFELKEEELRWDNLADIEGGLKESSTNSVVDCYYSEDDIEFPTQSNDDSYQGIGNQLTSTVKNLYKTKINNEDYSKSPDKHIKTSQDAAISQSYITDSKIISDYLSQSLPIFGKYSKTKLPKSLPIVPNKPVSFATSIRSLNTCSKTQYNFGDNVSEVLSVPSSSELKFMIPKDKSIPISKTSDHENLFHSNQLENKMLSSNNTNLNIVMHGALSNKVTYEGILNTIYKQQKEVALLFGQHPAQSFYPFNKPINLIPVSNSNPTGHMYSMQMHPENIHTDIENGMTHQNQECFMQNSCPTSINMSVPFHVARK